MGFMIYVLQKYQEEKKSSGKMNQDYLNRFYIYGALVVLLNILFVLVYHPYFFKMTRKGMQLRIACCNLIYRKALRLSQRALGKTTVGQMVNLLSNDVNRFDYAFIFVPFIFTAPLQAIISIVYLYYFNFKWAVFAGCAVLVAYLPFQMYMGTLFSKLRARTAILTDERIRLMNELIPAMRVIKMYTWEKPFAKLVEIARRNEVSIIKKTALLRGVNMALFFVSSKIMIFICMLVFIVKIGEFSPQHVFVAIALFSNLRTCLTLYFPYGISQGSEALISISRLQVSVINYYRKLLMINYFLIKEFLLLEEQDTDSPNINKIKLPLKSKDCGVWLNNVVASWNTPEFEPTLKNITFEVNPSDLLVIIGNILFLNYKLQI